MIVVVGIFVGLKVNDWDESHKENLRAEAALEDLRLDFMVINEAAVDLAAFYADIITDMETLIRNLNGGEFTQDDKESALRAVASGDLFGDLPPPSGIFRDLVSSGNLSRVRSKGLRLRLMEYDQSIETIAQSDLNISVLLSAFTQAFKRHSRLGASVAIPEGTDLAFVDVSLPGVSALDFGAMLEDPEFRVAAEQHLRLMQGRYVNVRVALSKIGQIRQFRLPIRLQAHML